MYEKIKKIKINMFNVKYQKENYAEHVLINYFSIKHMYFYTRRRMSRQILN